MIKNYNEILVEQYLHELLEGDSKYEGTCRCEECMDDVMAKALNNIRPFYVTCKRGEVFGKFRAQDYQTKSDMLQEIVKALNCVSKHAHKD